MQHSANGKYSVLDYFCFAEFLAYYTLENKSSKTSEYEPDKLYDKFSYPKQIKLMISGETMRCRKVKRIL